MLAALIELSGEWEAEGSCRGYRRNSAADIVGNRVFLAEEGGEIVGYLFGQMKASENMQSVMPEGTAYFEIEELYVRPRCRSRGVGGALFRFAEDALRREVDYLRLTTATRNWRAVFHFYLDEMGMEFWSAGLFKKINGGGRTMKIEKLTPAFKDYLWGGTKLRDVYHKPCDYDKVAESWELSTHPAGESKILGGEFDGLTLSEYFRQAGPAVLGTDCAAFENFPVLIKFIDAKDPLSIQVHPSDEYALANEGEFGKTEMWVVLDAEPGAFLYFGVNREISPEEFKARIENNTVLEVLNRVDVHPGDVFFIESGTLHAIGAGILICEIQQNSNLTYRVYDYDRRGADGKPRELHIEKALKVARLTPSDTSDKQGPAAEVPGGSVKRLASCKYFTTEKLTVDGEMPLSVDERSFISLIALEGTGTVSGPENTVDFKAGDSLFIPAGSGRVTVTGRAGCVKVTV